MPTPLGWRGLDLARSPRTARPEAVADTAINGRPIAPHAFRARVLPAERRSESSKYTKSRRVPGTARPMATPAQDLHHAVAQVIDATARIYSTSNDCNRTGVVIGVNCRLSALPVPANANVPTSVGLAPA